MYGRSGKLAPGYIDGRQAELGSAAKYQIIMWVAGIEKKCKICGSKTNIDVHHKDGNHNNNELENLMYLCSRCHQTIAHR